MPSSPHRYPLWDLPTRLFHWLLVLLLAAAWLTGEQGAMDWHLRIGLGILGGLVFRLVWGFVGGEHARFASFLRGPAAMRDYLGGRWRGLGHNPLGGWSALLLMLTPLAMVVTGLFANDDVAFQGPWRDWVDKAASDRLTGLHHLGFNLLLGLAGLHVAAIVYYVRVRKDNLVKPMLTGWKPLAEPRPAPRRAGPLALVLALVLAGGAVAGVLATQAPLPPVPPATATPDW